MKIDEIITREQASKFLSISKKKIFDFHKYSNNDWSYKDISEHYHLFRMTKEYYEELTECITAKEVWSFDDNSWAYRDKNNKIHKLKEKTISSFNDIKYYYNRPEKITDYHINYEGELEPLKHRNYINRKKLFTAMRIRLGNDYSYTIKKKCSRSKIYI